MVTREVIIPLFETQKSARSGFLLCINRSPRTSPSRDEYPGSVTQTGNPRITGRPSQAQDTEDDIGDPSLRSG